MSRFKKHDTEFFVYMHCIRFDLLLAFHLYIYYIYSIYIRGVNRHWSTKDHLEQTLVNTKSA